MDIHLAGSRPTRRAPSEYFTGTVLQDPIIQTEAPARLASTRVSFEPGARTAWHTHPAGQTLIVTEGVGWTQIEGGPKLEFHAGDILWCPAEHKHWHVASARLPRVGHCLRDPREYRHQRVDRRRLEVGGDNLALCPPQFAIRAQQPAANGRRENALN